MLDEDRHDRGVLPVGEHEDRSDRYLNTTVCDSCGETYKIGDYPFCPHDKYGQTSEFTAVWDENICPEGALITRPGQRRAIMKANNLDYKSRMGMPGAEY